jgi:uncharacterized protein (TIGR02646 family)
MIKLNKSNNVPTRLAVRGFEEKIKDMIDFNSDPAPFINTAKGTPKKKFDNGIYGHDEVKDQLKKDQFQKCCYCESKFTTNSPGDVEHFRPKGRFKIPGVTGFQKPAYYWLAYDWSNLFFSCEVCNRENKKEKFPLEDGCERAIPHLKHGLVEHERPLLICPTEEASNYIEFDKDTIKGKDERGRQSIMHYGLKRQGLLDDRLSSYKRLKFIGPLKGDEGRVTQTVVDSINEAFGESYSVETLKEIIRENNAFIADSISDNGEFSLMARSSFS